MLLNYSTGEVISDEIIVANTSEDQFLSHDTIFDVEVWSGSGKTGTQLVSGTDYSLVLPDSFNSVYNGIRFITNNGNSFYITYKTKGDYVDADDVNSKADKVVGATNGNLAGLNASGNLTDSGSKATDFATSGHSHSNASAEAAGFMSASDKTKLDGIAESANNYTHPATHSADIITDGTTNKAYTATEKTKLSGIATSANNYTHPNHSGDVTSVGDGATTIANDAVTNAKLANMAANTIKGRITASTGDPEDLTATQVRTIINVADGAEVNQNAFSTVAVSGQSDVVADSKTDTLTFVAGTNITITTDAGADSITINASGGTASSDFGAL